MRGTESPARQDKTPQVRGFLVGVTVAALAIAAHGAAGADIPESAGVTLLLLISGAAGVSAAVSTRSRMALLGWLLAGQLACHGALSALSGHTHGSGAVADRWMITAHVLAAGCCAVLLAVVERLYGLVSQAVRAATTRPAVPATRGASRWPYAAGVARHALAVGAIGPRAPPVPGSR
ncbi:hypothetical protein FOH10_31120 [Nocardia otitidiscaviarum]|uniref:Uncharacterized protein n=1 Tax=Nocardia otitidiscaviarum TaxID=1823 RepID=A0A516NUE6_9NOCA|nr:hypothetical protein [Nocardia otitidiscaviarum]MCP9621905.1 hypothetical protein [Nocardia otitidiscaviarum]QDP82518.1 hypothetical protein FOH10_31120 [Nocardia otitidiscaviarum]